MRKCTGYAHTFNRTFVGPYIWTNRPYIAVSSKSLEIISLLELLALSSSYTRIRTSDLPSTGMVFEADQDWFLCEPCSCWWIEAFPEILWKFDLNKQLACFGRLISNYDVYMSLFKILYSHPIRWRIQGEIRPWPQYSLAIDFGPLPIKK